MAATDSNIPRFLDVTKLNPPPSNAQVQIPDPSRLRCVDCLEETIPARVRSVV